MTSMPPPYDPQLSYATPIPRPPGVIMVLAIIGIIEGSLGVLCGAVGLASQALLLTTGGRNPFAPSVPIAHNPAVSAYAIARSIVDLAICIALLVLSIAAVKLLPWARRNMIRWAIVAIPVATIELVIQLAWIGPATAVMMRQTQSRINPAAGQAMGSMIGVAQAVTAVVMWLIVCALPVLVLLLWRSPEVVGAFEGTSNANGRRSS